MNEDNTGKTQSMQNSSLEPTRILVTGANGFLGRTVIDYLSERNYEITALVHSEESGHELRDFLIHGAKAGEVDNEEKCERENARSKILIVVADVTLKDKLDQALAVFAKDIAAVIHLAGLAHVSRNAEEEYRRVNTEGSLNLMKALHRENLRFIYISSSLAKAAEAGDSGATSYGISKFEAEKQLRIYAEKSGIELGILRPCNIYGRGMKGNLRTLIRLIKRRLLPPLPNYSNKLSLIADRDVAQAIQLQLETTELCSKPYFLTDGRTYSTKQIETGIYRALNLKIPKWQTPSVLIYLGISAMGLLAYLPGVKHSISGRTYDNLVGDNFYSNEEAEKDLGFTPSTDFFQALQVFVERI